MVYLKGRVLSTEAGVRSEGQGSIPRATPRHRKEEEEINLPKKLKKIRHSSELAKENPRCKRGLETQRGKEELGARAVLGERKW